MIYSLISKTFKYKFVRDIKERLCPLKQKLVGRKGIYYAIDVVNRLKKGNVSTVLDLGAAAGDYARTFLREFPKAKVFAFEPLPESFKKLKARTAEWDRVNCFNYGLYNENKEVEFRVSEYVESSSVNSVDDYDDVKVALHGIKSGAKEREVIKVQMRRLDDVVKELGITHIDFLKVDVEGAEMEVFEGAREALKITDCVFVDIIPLLKGINNKDYLRTFQLLEDAGLRFTGVYEDFFFTRLLNK